VPGQLWHHQPPHLAVRAIPGGSPAHAGLLLQHAARRCRCALWCHRRPGDALFASSHATRRCMRRFMMRCRCAAEGCKRAHDRGHTGPQAGPRCSHRRPHCVASLPAHELTADLGKGEVAGEVARSDGARSSLARQDSFYFPLGRALTPPDTQRRPQHAAPIAHIYTGKRPCSPGVHQVHPASEPAPTHLPAVRAGAACRAATGGW